MNAENKCDTGKYSHIILNQNICKYAIVNSHWSLATVNCQLSTEQPFPPQTPLQKPRQHDL
jgi:hypothetical protein